MTLSERQLCLSQVYADLEGFNRRRAYISTQLVIWDDRDEVRAEKYRLELNQIDEQGLLRYLDLRKRQTRYMVEYKGKVIDVDNSVKEKHFKDELYFFVDCEINTFENGWDLDIENAEDLIYEIGDYLLQYKFNRYLITNVKTL